MVALFRTVFLVTVAIGASLIASPNGATKPKETSPSTGDVADGSVVMYTPWGTNSPLTLREFNGRYVAFLLSDDELDLAGLPYIRAQIDRYDQIYATLKEFLGWEPSGNGLLKIAVINSGQAGDGSIGSKGCQITYTFFNSYQLARDLMYEVVKHEMIHNFDRYSSFYFNPPDPAHSWTDFMQPYVGVYSRQGFTDESEVNPDDWLEIMADNFFGSFVLFPNRNWTQCIAQQNCDGNAMAQHAQGGLMLRVAQLFGPADMRKWGPWLSSTIAQRGLSSGSMSSTDKNDLLFESLSNAVSADLTCEADHLAWPISSASRARIQSAFSVSVFCADQDSDGFTPFDGDFRDTDENSYPGAPEIQDGVDNDMNNIVDELSVTEPAQQYPHSYQAALPVNIPIRITGQFTGQPNDQWHNFVLTLTKPMSVRFRLRNMGGFNGDVTVYYPGQSRYSSQYVQDAYSISNLTLPLEAGQWYFAVSSSSSGSYELVVGEAKSLADSNLSTPPAISGGGSVLLSTASGALIPQGSTDVRFWISTVGWTDPIPLGSGGSQSYKFVPGVTQDLTQAQYGYQFLHLGTPISALSEPTPLLPTGHTVATIVNAASFHAWPIAALGEALSIFGLGISPGVAAASSASLPTSLANVSVQVTDSNGVRALAPMMFATPGQINAVIPYDLALGDARVCVLFAENSCGHVLIQNVSPGVFTKNASGSGVPAAQVLRYAGATLQTSPVFTCIGAEPCVAVPVDLTGSPTVLVLYGTGFGQESNTSNVQVTIDGVSAPVGYIGPQFQFAGLDQLNVTIPPGLAGAGLVDVVVTVDGVPANVVQIDIR